MKKKIALLLIGVLLVTSLLSGCGSSPKETANSSKDPAKTSSSDDKFVLKLSHTQNETAPVVKGLFELEKAVEERSGGRLQIEVYPNGMLGDTAEMVTQALTGSNVGFMVDAGRFSDFLPEIGILNAPYLFSTYEEGKKIVSTDLFKGWSEQLTEQGYRILSFNWYEGDRNFVTNKEINSMADLKDLKIRTGATPEWIATLNAFGAKPTALPQSEVYSGIQSKVVDGADQQTITVYGAKLYEIAKYYTKTGHYQLMIGLCVSDTWFNKLPEDLKNILVEESFKAGEYASQITLDVIDTMEEEMVEKGLIINDTIDLAEFKEAGETVYRDTPTFEENRKKLYELIGK